MEIEYLKEFITLAEQGQFLRTSVLLFTSQSTLTRHIQKLEKELSIPLFKRNTRELHLSKEGEIFLPYAKKIVETYEESIKELEKNKSKVQKTIGIIHNPENWNVAKYLISFSRNYPDIHFHYIEGSFQELYQQYDSKAVNIITIAYPTTNALPNNFIAAGKGKLVAAFCKNHPFAKKKFLTLKDLKGIPLFVPNENNFIYQCFKKKCDEISFTPNIVYRGNTNGMNGFIQEKKGVLIQDENIINSQKEKNFAIRSFQPEIGYIYGILYSDNLSEEEKTFVDFVRNDSNK